MKLSKIRYNDLNPRQKEVFNFQKVAAGATLKELAKSYNVGRATISRLRG